MKAIGLLLGSLIASTTAFASQSGTQLGSASRTDFSVLECPANVSETPDLGTIESDGINEIVVNCSNFPRVLSIRVDIPRAECRNVYHSAFLFEKDAEGNNIAAIGVNQIHVVSFDWRILTFVGDGKIYKYDIAAKIVR